jgi:hypothetical protein
VAGPFSALAPRLFDAIEELQREDPLERVDVLVGSNLLGLDLRRRLADALADRGPRRGHANVRFLTFLDLAREIAGPVPGRPAPPALLFALVAAAVPRRAEARCFGELRHRVGFVRALEATVRDLLDAGVPADAAQAWAEAFPDRDRRSSLAALASLYADVSGALSAYAHEAAVFDEAARRGATLPGPPLLVYGFYDFTGLQRDFLEALAKGRVLTVFLPRYVEDLGDFVRPTEEFLSRTLRCVTEATEEPGDRSARSLFLPAFAGRFAGKPLPADDTLAIVSAADDAGEAREAAREILIGREDGLPLSGTAILVRQERDAARFAAALGRAGIPFFRRPADSWADTPVGRALSLWLRLEEEGFRRDEVLDVLELSDAGRSESQTAHFRGLARQAGLVRGAAEWDAAVERLARAAADGDSDDEGRSRLATRLPGGPEAVKRLAERWQALRDSASGWPEEPATWQEWAGEARRRLERLFDGADLPEAAEAACALLDSLAGSGGAVGREVAFEMFLSGLASRSAEPGRLGRDGVAILTVMEARGVAFDHVILPGLVEKSFPARAGPDPLLFDEERESLARETGRPLATRTFHRPAEERLLFAIAADGAHRRLALIASRRDSALDRERTPSQFFTRASDAAGSVRRTFLGAATTFGPAVSLAEARRRALDSSGVGALAAVFPPLDAALVRRARRAARVYGPFEGRIASPDLANALAAHVPGPGKPVSPSALERFCKCAYQYFLRQVVGLRPVEDSDEPADLHPLELGTLVHDAARRAALARRGLPFSELSAPSAKKLAAACAAEAMEAFEAESGLSITPPLMREIALGRVREHVWAWLLFERLEPRGAFAPAGAEVRFGPATEHRAESDPAISTDEPALSEHGVPLRGQIDLVATDRGSRETRVSDFKVKLSLDAAGKIAKQRRDGAVLWSGEMLQLPVYALAAAGPLAGSLAPGPVTSEYVLLAPDPERPEPRVCIERAALDVAETARAAGSLELILEAIRASIAAGAFRPRPRGTLRPDQCALCDVNAVCGPGHERLYARKAQDPDPDIRRLALVEQIP